MVDEKTPWSSIGGVFSSLISTIGSSIVTNRQNRKNRKFQAEQAQIARDWQEEMYNKYSSPSAMVQQYKDAGLNPALAYNGLGQTFSGTSGMTSGSQMQPDFSGLDLTDFIVALGELKVKEKVGKSQEDLNEATAERERAEAERIRTENKFKPQLFQQQLDKGEIDIKNAEKGLTLLEANIENVKSQTLNNYGSFRNYIANSDLSYTIRKKALAEINEIGERAFLTRLQQGTELFKSILVSEQGKTEVAKRDEIYAKSDLVREEVIEKQWFNRFRDQHNMTPDQANTVWSLLLQALTSSLEGSDSRSFNINLSVPDSQKADGSSRIQNNE